MDQLVLPNTSTKMPVGMEIITVDEKFGMLTVPSFEG